MEDTTMTNLKKRGLEEMEHDTAGDMHPKKVQRQANTSSSSNKQVQFDASTELMDLDEENPSKIQGFTYDLLQAIADFIPIDDLLAFQQMCRGTYKRIEPRVHHFEAIFQDEERDQICINPLNWVHRLSIRQVRFYKNPKLIKYVLNANKFQEFGKYKKKLALLYAAKCNEQGALLLLKSPKLSFDLKDALFMACADGHLRMLIYLIDELGVDPSVEENNALAEACRGRWPQIAHRLLCDSRVDPSDNNNIALKSCAQYDEPRIMKMLLDDPRCDPSVDGNFIVNEAVERKFDDVLSLCISHPRVDTSMVDLTEFFPRACGKDLGAVQYILENSLIDPSVNNNAGFVAACRAGQAEIVDLLRHDERVDPTSNNSEAIAEAAGAGHLYIVKMLMSNVNIDPTRAFWQACANNRLEIAELLIEDARVNVNYNDKQNGVVSPLEIASKNGFTDIVKLLLADSQVDPNINESAALRLAAFGNVLPVVHILMDDERINHVGMDDEPLFIACDSGYLDLLHVLLEKGKMDPVECFNDACESGNRKALAIMIKDPRLHTPEVLKNALSIAKANEQGPIVQLLSELTVASKHD